MVLAESSSPLLSPPASPRSPFGLRQQQQDAYSSSSPTSASQMTNRHSAPPTLGKGESIVMIVMCVCHLIAVITSLNIAINDERDAAVATQSAWDMFDSSGAGERISGLSSRSTQFAWEATADALTDVANDALPRFLGGAIEYNSSSSVGASSSAIEGYNEIRPLHVVSSSVRLVQHRSAPLLCDNELLPFLGPSFFNFAAASTYCPGFSSGTTSSGSPMRCCIRDFTESQLVIEGDTNSFTSTNVTSGGSVFRRVEAESSVLFSGSGVQSAVRPDSIFYPFTGFSLDLRYAADLKTLVASSGGVPISKSASVTLGSPDVASTMHSFIDPLTRYVRFSVLTVYWSAAVCVHLHVHMEIPAGGAAVVSWRKASSVALRPGLFASSSSTIAESPSASVFSSSYNTALVVAEVFALLSCVTVLALTLVRYKMYFQRDKKLPIYANARWLLDVVVTSLVMLAYVILRIVIGFQSSSFSDALTVANNYETSPVSRETDFISGSWTRFIDSLRAGSSIMAFVLCLLWVIRYVGVIGQTIRRVLNAQTIGGAAEIAEDIRNGASCAELFPAVLRRYFVDVFRLMTWCVAPLFILCALALSVLRGPQQFWWVYSASALGTLVRDRVLNLFAGFIIPVSSSSNNNAAGSSSSYWSQPVGNIYWFDLIFGTMIEIFVPYVFFCGLVFVAARSLQEDVIAGRGKSAFFHHEDEEDAKILQMQLFPKKPGLAGVVTASEQARAQPGTALLSAGAKKNADEEGEGQQSAENAMEQEMSERTTQQEGAGSPANKKVRLTEEQLRKLEEERKREAAAGTVAVNIPPAMAGLRTKFGSTGELANDAVRRKLVANIRDLSENLRYSLGLVPPSDHSAAAADADGGPASSNKKKKKNFFQRKMEQIRQRQLFNNNFSAVGHSSYNSASPRSIENFQQLVDDDDQQQSSNPYLLMDAPCPREIEREAAIERLIALRKQAAFTGETLSAEAELKAIRGPLPPNIEDAIKRVHDMYDDLRQLLETGKSIRDALLEDTRKTVDQLEAEIDLKKKKGDADGDDEGEQKGAEQLPSEKGITSSSKQQEEVEDEIMKTKQDGDQNQIKPETLDPLALSEKALPTPQQDQQQPDVDASASNVTADPHKHLL